MLEASKSAVLTTHWLSLPAGIITCVCNVGILLVLQLPAVCQSLLTAPVQVATSNITVTKAVSVQPEVFVTISLYMPGIAAVVFMEFQFAVKPLVLNNGIIIIASIYTINSGAKKAHPVYGGKR